MTGPSGAATFELLTRAPGRSTFRRQRDRDARSVIVKVFGGDPSLAARELRTLTQLDSEYTVRAYGIERRDESTALVFEDFGGRPLSTIMQEHTLALEQRLLIATRSALALAEVHRRGYVHRALTSASVSVNLETNVVRLDDFHACVPVSELGTSDAATAIEGALSHVAPELTGRLELQPDHRADLYSLGVILFELFTARLPFVCATPAEYVHSHLAVAPPSAESLAPELPPSLCRLIDKLLAKSANDRYQSSFGVVADLERCLAQLRAGVGGGEFELGRHDASATLILPSRLYGRSEHSAALARAYADARAGSRSLVLISGVSGIGKTALVEDFRRVVVDDGGLLIRGKFDAVTHSAPFAVFTQALEQLMARLLGEGDEQLESWRETLLGVLGSNAQLLVGLVPSLELIIGSQPAAPEVGASERANRLNRCFAAFIAAFCQSGTSPLVLFLDDLQWADPASLGGLQQLLERTRGHLLVVGGCRTERHAGVERLEATLAAMAEAELPIVRIELGPLDERAIAELLAQMLARPVEEVVALAGVVAAKTRGVPFYVEQFVAKLHRCGALAFDLGTRRWTWDLARASSIDATQNVVEIMFEELAPPVRQSLERAACIGAQFDLQELEAISAANTNELLQHVQVACQAQMLRRVTTGAATMSFAFHHDGIQQCAYRRLEHEARAALHLALVRSPVLTDRLSLFERAGHLRAGLEQVLREGPEQRMSAARLCLGAARLASAQAAFSAAIDYLDDAVRLLPEDAWDRDRALAFSVHRELLEALHAGARVERIGELLPTILARARTTRERVAVLTIKNWFIHGQGKFEESLELELELIAELGLELPTEAEAIEARCRAGRERIDSIDDAAWAQLPPNTKSDLFARMLSRASSSALNLGHKRRFEMLVLETMIHGLDHGRSSVTALALAYYATLQQPRDQLGRGRAIALGAVASDLTRSDPVGRVHVEFSNTVFVYCWDRSFAAARASMERVRELALEHGDLVWSTFSLWLISLYEGLEGCSLARARRDCEDRLQLARDAKSPFIASLLQLTIAYIQTLEVVEPSAELERLDDFRAGPFAAEFIHETYSGLAKCVVSYLRGDHAGAWALSQIHAPAYNQAFAGSLHVIHTTFFHALIAAARAVELDGEPRADASEQLREAVETMKLWAEWVPENYAVMYLIARAEQRGLDGHGLAALDDYDAAIAAARGGPAYLSGIANERAARFVQRRSKPRLAWAYLGAARRDYERWGVGAKASALATELQELRDNVIGDDRGYTSSHSLDIGAVMTSVRAISSELDMDRLLAKTLDIIVRNAGAERGLLLIDEGALVVAASSGPGLPEAYAHQVVAWVERTGEAMVLADAAQSEQFAADAHVREHRPRSLLCMPIRSKRGPVLGVLYLENNLQAAVFSDRRLEILELLVAQCSISIENARLFRQKSKIESDLRTAYEIIGQSPIIVLSWRHDPPATMLFVSDNVERLLGYTSEEIQTWSAYVEILHPEDRARVEADIAGAVAEPTTTQLRQAPYRIETASDEIRWFDALILFDRDDEGRVRSCRGIVEDITEKHELTQQLLHAQKMDAIGLLASGVAHDFNNLLTVIAGNTEFLLETLPEDSELREEAETIASAATRATGVTRQLLSLSRRDRIEPRVVRMGEIVEDMLRIFDRVLGETIELELPTSEQSGQIEIDPSQLEQIVLNLVVNARDAMAKGGTLRIEVSNLTPEGRDDGRVRLSVSDTGCGMSAAVRSKIFEPFFTTKPAGRGTGLGLATVLRIVDHYGGSVTVDSHEGVGTTFHVSFARVDSVAPPADAHTADPNGGRGEFVLIVEDEPDIRELLARYLERHGYRPLTCESPDEALELIDVHDQTIDILLSDIVLAEQSGPELAEAILDRRPETKVVFMSGYAPETLAGRGVLRPGAHMLVKPFGLKQLVGKLREVLDSPG